MGLLVPCLRRLLGIAPLGAVELPIAVADGRRPFLANRMLFSERSVGGGPAGGRRGVFGKPLVHPFELHFSDEIAQRFIGFGEALASDFISDDASVPAATLG